MIENRLIWQTLLFAPHIEGGFSDRPLKDDPGGWTKYGITRAALAHHRGKPTAEITKSDVENLTLDECKVVANAQFWNPPRCTDMVGGVDVYLADFSFHSGPGQAVKILQRVLGFAEPPDVDGFMGPKTLNAAGARDPAELIEAYHQARMRFLRKLPNWEANKNGWKTRCESMRDLALTLAPKKSPVAVAAKDESNRNTTAWAATAATGLATIVPAIVEALPAAREGYARMAEALGPFAETLPWLIPVAGVAIMGGIIFLKVRSSTMATNASATGSVAAVVAEPAAVPAPPGATP